MGGGGVKKSQILAYVLYGWSLSLMTSTTTIRHQEGEGGVSQKMTIDDRGEGGSSLLSKP